MAKRAKSKLSPSGCFPGIDNELNVLPIPVENITNERNSKKLLIPKENSKGFPARNGVIKQP